LIIKKIEKMENLNLGKTGSLSFTNSKGEFLALSELSLKAIHGSRTIRFVEFVAPPLKMICIRDNIKILLSSSDESIRIRFSKKSEYKKVPDCIKKKKLAGKRQRPFEVILFTSLISRIDWE
jgi:hypothetical protein